MCPDGCGYVTPQNRKKTKKKETGLSIKVGASGKQSLAVIGPVFYLVGSDQLWL